MSASFVSQLRVQKGEAIRLAPEGAPALRVRVESADAWDTVRVDATANTPVAQHHEDYVVKLRGWEILDLQLSLGQAGAVDGSTLLVHHRRRRPVR